MDNINDLKDMQVFAVGTIYNQFQNFTDAYRIEYNPCSGFSLYITLCNPTKDELEQISVSSKFSAKFTALSDVGFFCFKFGNMLWGDAPFTPSAYKNVTFEELPDTQTGLALNVFLFEATTGELLYIRQIGLGHEFSKNLINWCKNARKMRGDEYYQIVSDVMKKYSTEDLVNRAEHSYTI